MRDLHFEEIDSTNDYCKVHYPELEDLSFVSASYQSKGKGRSGRRWSAHKGENLLFSLLIKNRPTLSRGPFLSLVASVALCEVLEEKYGLRASIKWPNDVYLNGKKVAGILLEGVGTEALVVGMGINVNQVDFDGEYRIAPTSLAEELGEEVDLDRFRDSLFRRLYVDMRISEDRQRFLLYYKNRDYLKGKEVRHDGETYTVEGVDEDYSLLLRKGKNVLSVVSGEVDLL